MNQWEEQNILRREENAFMHYNFIEMVSIERDRAVFKLEIRPESRNPYGAVHGGAIYTLADNTAGSAAYSDGRFYVTETSSMHMLRNQSEGTVYAKAWVRHRGKSTCLTSVDVVDENDRLLATGEFTFFCIDRERMTRHPKE